MALTTKTKKKAPVSQYFYATGKRKTSTARVKLFPSGSGKLTINERDGAKYLAGDSLQEVIFSPLRMTSNTGKFDIVVKILGGGKTGQAEAIRHGISKALLEYDPSLRITLKHAGFITRDSRIKERKKPGLKRARRAPQFSKR
ncbi:MAG: 30S ribosomal protein S9 [Patescibacteria group bacterium]